MHALFIPTPDLSYISGSSLALRYSVEALAALGVQCTVLCQRAPEGPHPEGVTYIALDLPLDYQIITDTTPTSDETFECVSELVTAALRAPTPDVIHATYGTFTGLAGATASAFLGAPLFVTSFGRDVAHGALADDRYRKMMQISYGAASGVFASDSATAASLASYTRPGTLIKVCPPGLEYRNLLLPETSQAASSVTSLLAIQSSFNTNKGLPLLVEALALLSQEFFDLGLTVVGHDDTPDQRNHRRLLAMADEFGVSDRITYTGHLSHADTLALLKRSDVLIDPRVINSFSNCVYEAMAVGVPVIASDVPCNRDALGGEERGLLFPSGDVNALAKSIRLLLEQPDATTRHSSAAYNYVWSLRPTISSESIAELWLGAYLEAVR